MEYFKSGIKSVIGSQQPDETTEVSHADTVERLVDRVQSSTLLEDRRDACRALKAMSRKYRLEVGAQGMTALCNVLAADTMDSEIISYALDTLCNITTTDVFPEEEHPGGNQKDGTLGEQFTEIFIKQCENVGSILSLLDDSSFRVRWPAVKLLTNLVVNKPRQLQEIILVYPMGVSKLMDLLDDNREVIRNDTLLLLIQLTKGNGNIQKIVAFENAFDRLFEVIQDEGYADGGIVVEDCLLFMLNLLRNNASNQNFFKEGSYIKRLSCMFESPHVDHKVDVWPVQKVSNVYCVLQVIRALVAPTNPSQVTSSCQKAMYSAEILHSLCRILMANGVPVNILTEAINATGEVIRGNFTNQEYFASIQAPCNPPRAALEVLLMSMVNEKQPIALRYAVLYCFQCFLFKNESGQSKLVQTLLPSSTEQEIASAGQLLCAGLFSNDTVSNWFAAVALSHCVTDNPVQKEQMLKVMLTPYLGSKPLSLLTQVTELLRDSSKVQSKLGYLMLLCVWLSHCPLAVAHFFEIPTGISYLTTQAGALEQDEKEELLQGICAFLMGLCFVFGTNTASSSMRESVQQLIVKRIGIETFQGKLNNVTRHESYSIASKHPHLAFKAADEILLDHEFCKLYRILEGMIIKAISPTVPNGNAIAPVVVESSDSNNEHYKDLIKEQDKKILWLSNENSNLKDLLNSYTNDLEDLRNVIHNLQQENASLKIQLDDFKFVSSSSGSSLDELSKNDISAQVGILTRKLRKLKIEKQRIKQELEATKGDQEGLLILLSEQDAKMIEYKSRLKAAAIEMESDEENKDARNNEEEN